LKGGNLASLSVGGGKRNPGFGSWKEEESYSLILPEKNGLCKWGEEKRSRASFHGPQDRGGKGRIGEARAAREGISWGGGGKNPERGGQERLQGSPPGRVTPRRGGEALIDSNQGEGKRVLYQRLGKKGPTSSKGGKGIYSSNNNKRGVHSRLLVLSKGKSSPEKYAVSTPPGKEKKERERSLHRSEAVGQRRGENAFSPYSIRGSELERER